ncbi:MAG: V-type ATP synthase subunit E family protein [Clostridia bacterium]
MMNAQAILQKIEDDARVAAMQAKTDAEKKVGELKAASNEKAASTRTAFVKQAEQEGAALCERMRRMAELELRKQLLQKKREVMDEAFSLAEAELCHTPPQEARAFLLAQAVNAASGDEQLVVGESNAEWFDDGFVGELNSMLTKLGKPAHITLSKTQREGVTGVILSREGTEVFCTFEAMLGNLRAQMETEIAQILFND